MHIILGFLGAVVTILVLFKRLSDAGIDIGWLNPFAWRRRRAWRNKYQGNPIFSLSDINIIFGDQHISSNNISLIKIKDSCLLRCDYYHLMNDFWSKKISLFYYKKIKQCLK